MKAQYSRHSECRPLSAWLLAACVAGGAACKASGAAPQAGVSPQVMADALHAVLEADRAVYTKHVVNRLQNEQGVIKASEHWKDDKALPLPAQMFRMGAELAAQKAAGLHYALVSPWAINRQNLPRTEAETSGLKFVSEHPDQNFYAKEELGGESYFTAVYPDKAAVNACVECHNAHKDSPRHDFKLGDVMGGVVIRITQSH
jgi:hypothetical protein